MGRTRSFIDDAEYVFTCIRGIEPADALAGNSVEMVSLDHLSLLTPCSQKASLSIL